MTVKKIVDILWGDYPSDNLYSAIRYDLEYGWSNRTVGDYEIFKSCKKEIRDRYKLEFGDAKGFKSFWDNIWIGEYLGNQDLYAVETFFDFANDIYTDELWSYYLEKTNANS